MLTNVALVLAVALEGSVFAFLVLLSLRLV